MKTISYSAFLRGINVGGHNIVKMENLRRIFGEMGFAGVKTYIQSGNVIFQSPEAFDRRNLTEKIEREMKSALGFEVKTMLRTFPELENVLRENPFQNATGEDKIYIAFLSAEPQAEQKDSLLALQNDFERFHFDKLEMYCRLRPDNPAKTLFSNNFIEKKLKVSATTRNISTVNKILLLQ